jgi:GntR family transcriptional regulator, rspAB operon transcriptional repressor
VYSEIRSTNSVPQNRNGLTAEIYETVKAEITAGVLKSRERLYETVLAKRFKTSRTPVREALQRLISEGLAEARPDGVCVAALSVRDVRGLEQANRALQSLAAELAAHEGSEAGIAQLEELMARMEACAAAHDLDGWMATDQDIHRNLFQLSGNRWLVKLLLQMESLIGRVRHLALRRPGRLEESTRQHRTIVDAVASHDGTAAYQAMYTHLVVTEQNLVELLELLEPLKSDRL